MPKKTKGTAPAKQPAQGTASAGLTPPEQRFKKAAYQSPQDKYPVDLMLFVLRQNAFMVYVAARKLGCTAQTIYNYRDRYPVIRDALETENGVMLDEAETSLRAAVIRQEPWAVTFLLKTRGRSRGYIERREVEHSGAVRTITDLLNEIDDDDKSELE